MSLVSQEALRLVQPSAGIAFAIAGVLLGFGAQQAQEFDGRPESVQQIIERRIKGWWASIRVQPATRGPEVTG